MDVRRTGRGVHAFVREEFGELSREEFPGVVAVRFVLVPQHVDGFEPGVVIHDDKRVTFSPIDGGKEGPRDVHMNETAGVRRLVQIVRVRWTCGVGFSAGRA
eukprot:1992728-Pleurochrysis_carterae.AAC.2